MIRTQIPRFRLPESVIDEECDYILDLGIEFRARRAHRQPEGAAGRGLRRDLRRLRRAARPRPRHPGPQGSRRQHPHRHRLALQRLVRPHRQDRQARHRARRRQHRDGLLPHLAPARRRGRQGDRPLRLRGDEGVALGEGGRDARGHPDPQFPGAEGIHPRGRQAHRRPLREGQGRVRRQGPPQAGARPASRTSTIECDDVLVAVGQENAFPWIERDIGLEFDEWDMPKVDPMTMQSTNPKVFFGGDAAFGPKNIIWAVAHGHEAAVSIDKLLPRRGRQRPAAAGGRGRQPEDGHPRVELRQRHLERPALPGAAARQGGGARRTSRPEVELGFDRQARATRRRSAA